MYDGTAKVAVSEDGLMLLGPFGLIELQRNGLVTISKGGVGPAGTRDVMKAVEQVIKISPNGAINICNPQDATKDVTVAPFGKDITRRS